LSSPDAIEQGRVEQPSLSSVVQRSPVFKPSDSLRKLITGLAQGVQQRNPSV